MSELPYSHIPQEQLADVFSRSITTMDGLWFLAAEKKFGFDAALELGVEVWEKLGTIQARRMVRAFDIKEENPVHALIRALQVDSVCCVYLPEITILDNGSKAVFCLTDCPPQKARIRDGKSEFPCKQVGIAFFNAYARVFDPKIKMTCLACPPDPHPAQYWCQWQFEI